MRYDVIVVGAGPAGSTTARECASRGLSVLMLDKAEFPRDKPCGGALTARVGDLLPFELTPVVERVIYGMRLSMKRASAFDRRSSKEIAYITQRRHLDAFLVEQAIGAGVSLREKAPIREVERYPSHFAVRAGDECYTGATLVAADGANGATAKLAGVDVGLTLGVAFEGNVTPPGRFPEMWEDALGLEVGDIPGGYGWLFPKNDHVNIGLGGWKYVGPSLKARLDELVRFYGFDPADLWGLRGHHLPLRHRTSPLVDGNMLLVGDAAGLLDPMTGEGIFTAIWSGISAAKHLTAYLGEETHDLDGYRRDVETGLLPDLRVSRQFHDLFHLTPGFYFSVERRTSIMWRLLCRLFRGEQTYAGMMLKHPAVATTIDFISDLVRVTPALQRKAGLRDPAPPERFFQRSANHHHAHPQL